MRGVDVIADVGREVEKAWWRPDRGTTQRGPADPNVRTHPMIDVEALRRRVLRALHPWETRAARQAAGVGIIHTEIELRVEPGGGVQLDLPYAATMRGRSQQARAAVDGEIGHDRLGQALREQAPGPGRCSCLHALPHPDIASQIDILGMVGVDDDRVARTI